MEKQKKIKAKKITYLGETCYMIKKSELRVAVEMVPGLNKITRIKNYLYDVRSEDYNPNYIYLNSDDIARATEIWKTERKKLFL